MTALMSWLKRILSFLSRRRSVENPLDLIFSELERDLTIVVEDQISNFRKKQALDGH